MHNYTLPPTRDERFWATMMHLSAFISLLIGLNFLAPLVLWLLKRDVSPFLDQQGKEAINFNLTFSLLSFVCFLLTLILIGWILLWLASILWLVFILIAAVQANQGKNYHYPLSIPFIR
jgi:hypothetical protein